MPRRDVMHPENVEQMIFAGRRVFVKAALNIMYKWPGFRSFLTRSFIKCKAGLIIRLQMH